MFVFRNGRLVFVERLCSSEAHTAGAVAGAGDAGTGGGGGEAAVAAFLAQIPEPIRAEAYFKDIKDVPNLATKAYNQAKLIGRLGNGADPERMVVLPQSEDPKDWAPVWERLGRPAAADQYALDAPKGLPEGLTVDAELQQRFVGKAHEIGLSQKQAAQLYEWWNGERSTAYTGMTTANKARQDAAVRALQADPNFGGSAFQPNLDLAQAFLAQVATPELIAELDRTGLGDHPEIIKVFAKLGREYQEDGLIGGKGAAGAGAGQSPAELEQQMNALRGDPNFRSRYHSRDRAIRTAAIAEMNALAEQLAESRTAAGGGTGAVGAAT